MSAPRSHGWLLLALGAMLVMAPTAMAQGSEDLPPIMPQDLTADPSFENVSAETEEMAFTVQLTAVEEAYTGDFTVDLSIEEERVALIEDTWTAGTQTRNVTTDEDADQGPGTWSPSVGLHPFNLTISADGESFPLEFKLPTGPDLTVEGSERGAEPTLDVTMEPAEPAPGDEVTFHLNVTNQGSWATPEGTPAPVALTLDGEEIGRTTVQNLEAEEDTQLTFADAWTAEGGHHTIAATAAKDAFEEILDENNNASMAFTVQQPGLSVRALEASPSPVPANGSLTLEATLENTASERREASTTAVYLDGELHRETDTDAVEPGETTNVTWQLEPGVGVHELTVLPEAEDAPDEPPADASSATRTVTVGPDLAVTGVGTEPAQPLTGDEVTVNATVTNRGAATNGSVPVALIDRLGDQTYASTNVSALETGERTEVELTLEPEAGDYDLLFQIDPEEAIGQAERGNDHGFVSFTVREQEPELVIESVGFEDELVPGQRGPAQVTVTNEGSDTVTDLEARFQVDDTLLGQGADVGSLDPDETATVESRNWTAEAGEHELSVRIGSPHDFAAGHPLASATRTVTVADADANLTVGELATEPARPSPGDEVKLLLDVTNEGPVPATGFTVEFTVDGERIGMRTVDELAPGANRTLESPAWTLDAETTSASAVVAPNSEDLETREITATLAEASSDVPGPAPVAILAAIASAAVAGVRRRG